MKTMQPRLLLIMLLCLWLGLTPRDGVASEPGMGGTWVVDLSASDSTEELLKAQGVNVILRTAARGMVVTQHITVGAETVSVTVESAIKSDTQDLRIDNAVRTIDSDRGPARVRHYWDDGGELVTVAITTVGDREERTTIRRVLSADGATLTQRITFENGDGKVVCSRIFRRS